MKFLLNHRIGDNMYIDVKEPTRNLQVLTLIYFYLQFYLLHHIAVI